MNEAIKDDAERKQVTVLFADVSGSMDLAEQEDPEEWREIMQRFFSSLADTVTRFEGTVDKFTGDGIMAIFGAPIAHEDHARRACYAALQMLDDVAEYAAELRRAKGLNFSTRIGINSGEVVAGAIDGGGGSTYTAIGHTVGLAQRMEALAEPGKAYLTESTAELARGYLDLRDLGEFEIKGASRPVAVFELAGVGQARSRLDLARERGFSNFVGREEELARLEAALARARGGEATAMGVVAEAGIGKSRLYHEFAQRCRGEGLEVFEAQAQAHGRSIPFMPILQMLRSFYGIGDRDPEQMAREKIAGRSLLLDPDFAADLPLIFDFLGVPDPERPVPKMNPEGRGRALGDFLCRLVSNPARSKTLVLIVEDLHWIDEGSQMMLHGLVEGMEGTPTLVLVNYRPEHTPAWSESPVYETVDLQPLDREDTAKLLRDIIGCDPSLDGIDEPIHERTGGNPFFIEEIVRELDESGYLEGRTRHLPIGAADRGRRRAGHCAGGPCRAHRPPRRRSQAPAPGRLGGRQGGERGGSAADRGARGGRAGAHPAGADRRRLPLRSRDVPAATIRLPPSAHPRGRLRHPARQPAGSHPRGRGAGDDRADSAGAPRRARGADRRPPETGRRNARGGALVRARRPLGRPQPPTRRDAPLARDDGAGRGAGGERGERRARDRLPTRPDSVRLARRHGPRGAGAAAGRSRGDRRPSRRSALDGSAADVASGRPGLQLHTDEWLEQVEEMSRLADEAGDPHLRVAIRAAGAYAYLIAADFAGFERALDEIVELADGDITVGSGIILNTPLAWAEMGKGMAQREQGDLDGAERHFARALEIADEADDPETASWVRSNQAGLMALRGDIEGALSVARRNCELTERIGDVFSRSLAIANLAWAQLAAEEYQEALDSIEEADRTYREAMKIGGEMEAWRSQLRARALVGVGRVEEALAEAEWAVQTSEQRGLHWSLPIALLALGRARHAAGRDDAVEALEEARRVAVETNALTCLTDVEAQMELVTAG